MASPSSLVSFTWKFFLNLIELLSGDAIVEKFKLKDLPLKYVLLWVFEFWCEVAVKLVDIE